MAVITVDDLKNKYSFTFSTNSTAVYENYISVATEACMKVIGLSSEGTAVCVDYFDSGFMSFSLYSGPVVSIDKIECWNGAEWIDVKLSNAIIQLGSGIVSFRRNLAVKGDKTVRITYTAGFNEWPTDLKMCIAMTVQHLAKMMQSNMVGVNTRTLDGGVEALDANIPPLAVQNHLQRYRIGRAR